MNTPTISPTNPFPAYPVVRISENAASLRGMTAQTLAIAQSREYAAQFTRAWLGSDGDPAARAPVIVAVKGDYGTGKTHLLLDAEDQIRQALAERYPLMTLLRVAGTETDPWHWFAKAIGPEILKAPLGGILTTLYAEAGQAVAGSAELTRSANETIAANPKSVYGLVKEDLLNASAVEQKLHARLREVCTDATEDILRALGGLVWNSHSEAASRWLAGEALDDADRRGLRLTRNLSEEGDAWAVLVSVAALYHAARMPFGLIVDEVEHFMRCDAQDGRRSNLTWLKRLLEGLAHYDALVYIAGHWSAWDIPADYKARFPQPSIDIYTLNGQDVLLVVERRVPALNPQMFGAEQAAQVARIGKGNIRRILSICRLLFNYSAGFQKPIAAAEVEAVVRQMGNLSSVDAADLTLHEILEDNELDVRRDAVVSGGIAFDIAAFQGDEPRVLVAIKHALIQVNQHEDGRRFIEQMGEVHKTHPKAIGCFVADGNTDPDWLANRQSAGLPHLLWFDLNRPDEVVRIRTTLDAALRELPIPDNPVSVPSVQALDAEQVEAMDALPPEPVPVSSPLPYSGLKGYAPQPAPVMALPDSAAPPYSLFDVVSGKISAATGGSPHTSNARPDAGGLDARLEAIESRRHADTERQQTVLSSPPLTSPTREVSFLKPQAEETLNPRVYATYQDMTRPASLSRKVRLAGPRLALAVGLIVISLGGLVLPWQDVTGFPGPKPFLSREPFFLIKYVLPATLLLSGLYLVYLMLMRVDQFLGSSARLLRLIYLRNGSAEDLVRADYVLQRSLELYGPQRGILEGERTLNEEIGVLQRPAAMNSSPGIADSRPASVYVAPAENSEPAEKTETTMQ